MQFKLVHHFPLLPQPIGFEHQILSIGSCFAENIGQKLLQHKFQVMLNPSGILFNPISVLKNLEFYLDPEKFWSQDFLFEHEQIFHSWMHHGVFSSLDKQKLKTSINNNLVQAHKQIAQLDYLFITWGSAYVYELISNKQVVANCHKVPQQQFSKRLLSVNEIVHAYENFFAELQVLNPNINVVWSVSPVKYLKEGIHENNLSKSVLHLTMHELMQKFPSHYYFPAFEMVQDELRDYRFYATDFAHPNEQAIDYIWEEFISHCINPNSLAGLKKIGALNQALQHRPLHPDTEAFAKFKQQQILKIQELMKEFPMLHFEEELKHFL